MSTFRFEWRGDEVMENVKASVKKGLLESGLDLKQRSQSDAPVDKGDLRANCSVLLEEGYAAGGKPEVTKDEKGRQYELPAPEGLTVRIGYALPYALAQHENLKYHHDNGKAKYLESPFEANKKKYKDHVARAAGKGLKGT